MLNGLELCHAFEFIEALFFCRAREEIAKVNFSSANIKEIERATADDDEEKESNENDSSRSNTLWYLTAAIDAGLVREAVTVFRADAEGTFLFFGGSRGRIFRRGWRSACFAAHATTVDAFFARVFLKVFALAEFLFAAEFAVRAVDKAVFIVVNLVVADLRSSGGA